MPRCLPAEQSNSSPQRKGLMSALSLTPALSWSFARVRRRSQAGDVQVLQLLTLLAAFLAIVFQLLWYLLSDPAPMLNLWIPVSIAGFCCWGVILLICKKPLWMWSPLTTALAAIGVFHGFGPLLHVFGNPSAIAYANQFAPIDAEELARTNLLDGWSLVCILWTFTIFFRSRDHKWFERNRPQTTHTAAKLISWSTICIALPVKYFVVLPYFLGWVDPDFVVPGFVVVFGKFSLLALFLLLYYAWSRSALFYVPAIFLFVLELMSSILLFSKTDVIMTLGVAFLGLYFVRPSRLLATSAFSVIAVAYLIVTPLVSKGRLYIGSNRTSISDRLDALEQAWSAEHDQTSESGTPQGWWSRLCYSNAQAFCMRQYEAGIPGDTFRLILPAIVPRIIWPDKPIMTPGFDFNQLVTRNSHSSSAAGVFAEAYWNAGWTGVALTCAYIGFLFSWFTKVTFKHVAARDVRCLPFAIGGLLMAASITDWFASTYVGGASTYLVYFAVTYVLIPGDRRTASAA